MLVQDGNIQMNDSNDHKDRQRLADIDRRLDKLQADREQKDRPSQSALPEGAAAIMGRVATELVAGVIVGTFIGWVLDLNVWRVFTGRGLAAGYFDEHKNSSDLKSKGSSDPKNKGADRT